MKIIIYTLSILWFLAGSSLLHSEPYCFVNGNGKLECIDLKFPIVVGGAGGGGCGGSSACGNNNLGTDWIDPYIKKHPQLSNNSENFKQILEQYKNRSIQLELIPVPETR